jgi:hypothetical protein
MFESTKRTSLRSENIYYCFGSFEEVESLECEFNYSSLFEIYFVASYCIEGGGKVISRYG